MKIIAFTGSRAEYYLQRTLFQFLSADPAVDFYVLVAPGILNEQSGQTLNDIQADGLNYISLVSQSSGRPTSHACEISNLIALLEPVITDISPDYALVYADRFESFAFAVSAFHHDCVLFHLESGDITQGGTYDDSIRHAISAISHVFISSTQKCQEVVQAMGAEAWRTFHSGLLSYDSYPKTDAKTASDFFNETGLILGKPLVLATYHPIPRDRHLTQRESSNFFEALSLLSTTDKYNIIITAPNADHGRDIVIDSMEAFKGSMYNTYFSESLGGRLYHALMSLASSQLVIVAGNSSSVIKEAPYHGAISVNYGVRQEGRESASSQHDFQGDATSLFHFMLSLSYNKQRDISNPYYKSEPSLSTYKFITRTLASYSKPQLLRKKFVFTPTT